MQRLTLGSFSLETPPGWKLTTVILAGPSDDSPPDPHLLTPAGPVSFQQNIVATMEPVEDAQTPEGYVRQQLEGLLRAGVSRREAAPPERVPLAGGLDGLLTEQVLVSPQGRVRQMQLVSIKDKVAHTIIASNLDGPPFQRARERFRQILRSFQ